MTQPILIISITDAEREMLSASLLARIKRVTLLVGGKRHLAHFPDAQGERLAIGANIEEVVARLRDLPITTNPPNPYRISESPNFRAYSDWKDLDE